MSKFTVWLRDQSLFRRTIAVLILYAGIGIVGYGGWQIVQIGNSIFGKDIPSAPVDQDTQKASPSEAGVNMQQLILEPDPQAILNPVWKNQSNRSGDRKQADNSALSRSGYPIIVILKSTAVCTGPVRLQLAMDLQLARRESDVGQMSDCIFLPPQTRAEWINPNPFGNGVVEIRLHPATALPVTVYGPDPRGGESPFYSWFGTLQR